MIGWRLAPGIGIGPADQQPSDQQASDQQASEEQPSHEQPSHEQPTGAVLLTVSPSRSMVLRPTAPGIADALLSLGTGARSEAELAELAPRAGAALERQLSALLLRGALELRCVHGGRELLRVGVTSELAAVTRARPPAGQRIQLSRFACLRRVGEELVVESLTGHTRLIVGAPEVAALLALLAEPQRVGELCESGRLPAAVVLELLELLITAKVAGALDEAGRLPEDVDPVPAQREFHDVLLHWHSRRGLAGRAVGMSYPFRDRFPPPAAVKPVQQPVIALPRPDLARLRTTDPPFAEVAEERRSVRAFTAGPLTLEQLGEFLYRTARVREELPADEDLPYDRTLRPVPSAGAAHELELYLTVTRCQGLASGVYHYEPLAHGLTLVTAEREAVVELVRDVCRSLTSTSVPQVVVTLAARFNRLSWKYRGLSYATTLKNVGVLYQAMYLAATAMRLGGCAAGGGESAVFARITGLDLIEESSVGEFVLGIPLDRDTSTRGTSADDTPGR
ncbi:SagB family peptide dehydrogenase [Kitasatospora sp. NBC_01287]|uniref:SagB/ThcOx family dehydrogenase n=1 Tax=Kitasatospora sp. NBC_01287 TaxID=2903573 RepID=UPI00225907BD|nr:SagB family peptide dehydrogenase [Kitasatospora sp. NBC_01287]MCX4748199.1 SagB family peptide dehydrogenase [Kitasatospora sp. NBC_01287]